MARSLRSALAPASEQHLSVVVVPCGGDSRHLPHLWPTLEKMLAPAMEYHDFLEARDLLDIISARHAELALVIDGHRITACLVLEIVQYPRVRVCNVIAAAGENGSLRRYAEEVDAYLAAWCRSKGCAKLSATARRGWARHFAAKGWHSRPFLIAWKDA